MKGSDHIGRREDGPGHARETKPGVVVDEVDDLDLVVVGQVHMGDVALPALVGQIGHEAHIGRPGPLVGLGDHEATGAQHPPDGGDRGHHGVTLRQMEGDGRCPGIEARRRGALFAGPRSRPRRGRRSWWVRSWGASNGAPAPRRPRSDNGPGACRASCGALHGPWPAHLEGCPRADGPRPSSDPNP